MGRKLGGEIIADAIDQYNAGSLINNQPRIKPRPIVSDSDQAVAIALRERDERLGTGQYAKVGRGRGPKTWKSNLATFEQRYGKWPDPVVERTDDGDSGR